MTFLPVTSASFFSIAAARSGGNGSALVTSAWTTLRRSARKSRYVAAISLQQDEPVAVGEQHEQLRDDRREARARRDLFHRGALAGRGHRRVQHQALEGGLLTEKRDELVEFAGDRVRDRPILSWRPRGGRGRNGRQRCDWSFLIRGPLPPEGAFVRGAPIAPLTTARNSVRRRNGIGSDACANFHKRKTLLYIMRSGF